MRLGVTTPTIEGMNHTEYRSHRPAVAFRADATPLPVRHVLAAAMVAGLLLGPLDLLAQTTLPYPWANLANSGAVWALGACVIGMWSRGVRSGAVAAIVLLVVAVESYYVAAVIVLHDSTTTLWSGTTALWLALAVVVGPIFGVVGSFIHSERPGIRLAAAAFAGSIFMTEAIAILGRSPGGRSSGHDIQTALIEIALAVIVPLILLTVTATYRRRTHRQYVKGH